MHSLYVVSLFGFDARCSHFSPMIRCRTKGARRMFYCLIESASRTSPWLFSTLVMSCILKGVIAPQTTSEQGSVLATFKCPSHLVRDYRRYA